MRLFLILRLTLGEWGCIISLCLRVRGARVKMIRNGGARMVKRKMSPTAMVAVCSIVYFVSYFRERISPPRLPK